MNCSFLNIITELIAGYAWPGKPIANMMVKCYGYNSVKHGMDFAQDLKLGQYMVRQAPFVCILKQSLTLGRVENSSSCPLCRPDILYNTRNYDSSRW